MRFYAALLIVLLLSAPALADPFVPEAEMQVGDPVSPRAVQAGALIFLNGLSEDVDDVEPPIEWPKAVEVLGGDVLEIVTDVPTRPASVELTFWSSLRKNGLPKQKIGHTECFPDPMLVDDCRLLPGTNESNHPGWVVTFDAPRSKGHLYIAANFTWDDSTTSQAAWLMHARLLGR